MINEQNLARRMLALRETDYSLAYVLRRSLKVYFILLGGFVAAIAGSLSIANTPAEKTLFVFGAGLLLGTVVRDFTWLRAIKRQWPFTKRVTDWDEVERIASL